jgi:hypothetical protein
MVAGPRGCTVLHTGHGIEITRSVCAIEQRLANPANTLCDSARSSPMDRLQANQSLRINEELVSNNGWFRLAMRSSGGLVLYRTQVRHTWWVSTAVARVGAYAMMQADGNFVIRWPQGAPYWTTGTAGHPGASVVLQNDGNLVVVDSANRPVWASNTALSLPDQLSPTILYVAERGASYNETSEWWKDMCTAFPCFFAMQWPGYVSDIVEDVIDGQPVVIQLWKGYCAKFLGFAGVRAFPGGIGAEVGIYRRIPGKSRLPQAPFLQGDLSAKVSQALTNLTDNELWWPAPELGTTLEFNFIDPVTGDTVFSAGPQKSYWLTKWMEPDDYQKYQDAQPTPIKVEDYILEYKVNGKLYPRWPAGAGSIANAVQPGWQLLLS